MRTFSQIKKQSLVILLGASLGLLTAAPSSHAHTKGISLSRYGLVDVSWSANLAAAGFLNYDTGFNTLKLGERHFQGLNLTSFDLSFTQDFYDFPAKWALFTAWGFDEIAIEEAFVLFHKMPAWLQVKTGIFRVNFGKLNQYHDHEWAFADPPLINTLFLGVDGVHNVGIEASIQPPTPIFTEFSVALLNGQVGNYGQTFPGKFDFASAGDSLNNFHLWSRGTTFVDITDDFNFEMGVSAAVGRNKPNGLGDQVLNPQQLSFSANDTTALGGLDFTFTYKPKAFAPYIRWTTEFLMAQRTNPIVFELDRSLRTNNTSIQDTLTQTLKPSDLVGGFYSEFNYRFDYHWDAGARLDVVGLPAGNEDPQTRLTANVRYFINPVSRLNLQYSYGFPSGRDAGLQTVLLQLNVGGGTVTPGVGKFYNLF
jgi:hypothetical protein